MQKFIAKTKAQKEVQLRTTRSAQKDISDETTITDCDNDLKMLEDRRKGQTLQTENIKKRKQKLGSMMANVWAAKKAMQDKRAVDPEADNPESFDEVERMEIEDQPAIEPEMRPSTSQLARYRPMEYQKRSSSGQFMSNESSLEISETRG